MRTAAVLATAAVVAAGTLLACPTTASAAQRTGQVTVVQALPGVRVSVTVDGRRVVRAARVGSISDPMRMRPGKHTLVFRGLPGGALRTTVTVRAGRSNDVVLHRPAAVGGEPVVNTYRTPNTPIGPGKARVLLAHTATVAPADVELDGQVVFTDIANGEFAQADVPAGAHRVALLPTGRRSHPILGPLRVTLAARTATMVYAVGNPRNRSMNVVVHTLRLSADGSRVPETIRTGSAGLAAGIPVVPFGPPGRTPARPSYPWVAVGLVAAGALLPLAGLRLARTRART